MVTLVLNAFFSVAPLYLPLVAEYYPGTTEPWEPRVANHAAAGIGAGMVLLMFLGWMARAAMVARARATNKQVIKHGMDCSGNIVSRLGRAVSCQHSSRTLGLSGTRPGSALCYASPMLSQACHAACF